MPAFLRQIRKRHYTTLLLLVLVYTGTLLCAGVAKTGKTAVAAQPADSLYAGSAACMKCHQAIYDSFIGTAHYFTSRPAAAPFIKGSFNNGENHFSYNPFMEVRLEKKESGFFQTVYVNGEPTHSESIDIVVGSGKKGQTYLYWKDNILYQLPVSYYVPAHSWCNSPGYPPGVPRFNRIVSGRCLECHGSNAVITDAGNKVDYFDRTSIVYGVDCERCHGPSASHVAFHTAHPEEKQASHILNQKGMSRQQNLDVCALCHSGIRTALQPAFTFRAGDRLDQFSLPKYNADSAALLDVHGNQYGLLTSSKCFTNSQLTCSSCHSPHGKEVNEPALFSQRCMNCHNSNEHTECKIKPVAGIVLSNNCIDCHMPSMPSKAIFLQLADPAKSTADLVRSHRIAIYPAAAKEFIRLAKAKHRNG